MVLHGRPPLAKIHLRCFDERERAAAPYPPCRAGRCPPALIAPADRPPLPCRTVHARPSHSGRAGHGLTGLPSHLPMNLRNLGERAHPFCKRWLMSLSLAPAPRARSHTHPSNTPHPSRPPPPPPSPPRIVRPPPLAGPATPASTGGRRVRFISFAWGATGRWPRSARPTVRQRRRTRSVR